MSASATASQTPTMDDFEIRKRVESIAGKNARVVDCEKKSSFVSEETLLINGIPVKLEGKAGERIKEALKSGQPPPVELLSEILVQAGIQKNPVQLETTMTVKSSTKTSELSTLRDKAGKLVDEKLKEFEEDDEIQSASVEIWEKDSKEAQKIRKTFDDFRTNVKPFIIPKPLPRTHTPDRTPPKTPAQSPQSPVPPKMQNGNGTSSNINNHSNMSNGSSPTSSQPSPSLSNNNRNRNNILNLNQKPSSPSPQYQHQTQYQYQNQYQNHHISNNNNNKQRPSDPPPRIPSLIKPFKMNFSNNSANNSKPNPNSNKPIPPPKPNKAKLQQQNQQNQNQILISSSSSSSSPTDSLRREKNFELPVRVVYETFI